MNSDKLGGRPVNPCRSSLLWKYISHCNLIDLGYKGCKFIWSNHRKRSKGLIMERFDRIFINDNWLDFFPTAFVTHLPKTYSDHNPLLLTLSNNNIYSGPRPFRLESFWCNYPDFVNIINSSWSNNLITTSGNFQKNVLQWKNTTFGDFLKKKRTILARLSGIQASSHYHTSTFLQNLEDNLKREYNDILKIEEDY